MKCRTWIGFFLTMAVGLAACGDDGAPTEPDAASPDASMQPDAAPEPTPDAMLAVFDAPESVRWDPERGAWYISNIGGDPSEKDGNGWIVKADAAGNVVAERWLQELNAPKGMALLGDKLYVADIDQIVVVSIDANGNASIDERIDVPDAVFLNDVAAGDSEIYVSDTEDHAIYRLQPGSQPEQFVKSDTLKNPNGLLVEADRLVVAGFGTRGDNTVLGALFTISLDGNKTIAQLGSLEGKFDAIEADGDTYLVSDFRGTIHRVLAADGAEKESRDTTTTDSLMSSADLGFDPVRRVVAIPDLLGDDVVFVSMELDRPESALWDATREVWYVSNISGESDAKDGTGWITRFDKDGKVLEPRWVEGGLNAPKGMALVDNTLYVADIDRVAAIDIEGDGAADQPEFIGVPNAMFLNDVTAIGQKLFVSDTRANIIFEIELSETPPVVNELLKDDPLLKNPNGLVGTTAGDIIIASVGEIGNFDDFGPLLKVTFPGGTPTLETLGTLTGKLDGVVVDTNDNLLISDLRGQIFQVAPDGTGIQTVLDATAVYYLQNAADIGYDPATQILAIPDLNGHAVIFDDLSD